MDIPQKEALVMAEDADDEYELTYANPVEFRKAHESYLLFHSNTSPNKKRASSGDNETKKKSSSIPSIQPAPSRDLHAWTPTSVPQVGTW